MRAGLARLIYAARHPYRPHHRLEAARRALGRDAHVELLIIEGLSDYFAAQMMISENSDYWMSGIEHLLLNVAVAHEMLSEIVRTHNSYDLAFSKFKAHMKRLKPRTIDDLWKAAGTVCDLFKPEECMNFFAADGYAPQ